MGEILATAYFSIKQVVLKTWSWKTQTTKKIKHVFSHYNLNLKQLLERFSLTLIKTLCHLLPSRPLNQLICDSTDTNNFHSQNSNRNFYIEMSIKIRQNKMKLGSLNKRNGWQQNLT